MTIDEIRERYFPAGRCTEHDEYPIIGAADVGLLLAEIDRLTRDYKGLRDRSGEDLERLLTENRALTARNAALEKVAHDWLVTRSDAYGKFSTHFPIDETLHGNRTTPEQAWGCNSCGRGWPCLVIRTQDALGESS